MGVNGVSGIVLAVTALAGCQQWSPEQRALLQRAQVTANGKLGTTLDAEVLTVGSGNENWACGKTGKKGEWAYVERQGHKPELILPSHQDWDTLIMVCHNAPGLKRGSATAAS